MDMPDFPFRDALLSERLVKRINDNVTNSSAPTGLISLALVLWGLRDKAAVTIVRRIHFLLA
jgi:hypothetical protein